MDLDQAIRGLYPDLSQLEGDFLIQDDGQGLYIKEWNNPYPRPTQKDLERGVFFYALRTKAADWLAKMTETMSLVLPEATDSADTPTLEEVNRKVDALYLLLTDLIMAAVAETAKKQQVKDARDKFRRGRSVLQGKRAELANSADPDYLAAAEQVTNYGWETQ